MTISELLGQLRDRGIVLACEGDELLVRSMKRALDPALLEALRANKPALQELIRSGGYAAAMAAPHPGPLAELTGAEIDGIVAGVPGGADNVQDIYPLAPLQEGILFHHLMTTEGDPYLLGVLHGVDSRDALDRYLGALQAVVDRHDILRTAVVWEGLREPVQVVWRKAPLAVEEVELDPADGDAAGQLYARFDPRHYRMDVRQAPLMRAHIAHDRAGDRWLLLLLCHHLISDHATLEVLQSEIDAHLSGRAHTLPEPLPFRDYVAQARLGVGQEEHRRFFEEMLGDVDEPTAPFGVLDVRGDGSGMEEARLDVDAGLAARLRGRARALGVSAASVFHVAWAQVLARASGREDVVFGTLLFGRMYGGEGSTRVMGPFINTLPIRVRAGGTGVEACVRRTHALLAGLLRHEHASLALAQRCSGVEAPAPLFTALLNYRHGGKTRPNAPAGTAAGAMTTLYGEERTNYPLALSVDDRGEGFRLVGQVMHASLDPARVCGLVHRALEGLVEALERAPERAVGSIDVLPESERARVLEAWNRTEAAYPAEWCIHELFEASAARTPDAAALVFEGERLTYAELNRRANRLAHHLRSLGVGPDARVALCVERSVEMVVGLLATLKAGGAYVPLDPGSPAHRLRRMLADCGAAALLAQRRLAGAFGEPGVPLLVLDEDGAAWARAPETNPERAGLTADHLAYVIYTSGSTGEPKGVMNAHRGVVNRLLWMQDAYGLGAGDSVLQKTTYAFDVSVWEFFWTLGCGARLVMARPEGHRDPAYLAATIRAEGITTVHFVPSMLQLFVEHPGAAACTGLRRVVCSGEALPPALVERFHAALPGVELHNLYGPTEAAVDVTAWRCLRADAAKPRVPLGRPIANTRMYVLDAAGRPVPGGAAGELFIGGVQVARGYAGRPALTAERFVPDPFGAQPGARLYRTGDLGRWLPDGTLEYLGRNDFQVKVRGFRIEPGEIESRLAEHPSVREAVVVARGEGADGRRLVAYWAGADEVAVDRLRAHLLERLPEHMVPAAFVRLEALPLTPSGKVDRKALPAPEDGAFARRGYEAPVGETEAVLAEIWAEVLGVERVGRRDDFFELGGHSLLAVRVISRVRQALRVEAALRELFARPVLADFARALETAARSELPPVRPAPREGPIPLSFAQQRLWFLEQLGNLGSAYHIRAPLRLRGPLDRGALGRALDAIVARHEALRTTFAQVAGIPEQRIAPAEASRFPLAADDLEGRADAEAELGRRMAGEARAPFDLERGPLIRGRLIRLAEEDHVLLLTMHHIVSDGWSMGVLFDELSALYAAHREGREAHLPELPVQYADYAAWQRRWMEGDVLQAQADYWTETLAGAPELLELPADHPRPARMDHAGELLVLELDEALTAGLRALGRRHGTTLFMTLLAGWATVLSRLSGQAEVVVGTPAANRGRREIEGVIGFFVNTLALRLDLSGAPTVAELLARVKERALGAQHHQDIPFEQVVELVDPARSLSHTPVFQVMFAWQDTVRGDGLSLAGLEVGRVGTGASHVEEQFDLSLSLRERDDRITGSVSFATALFERASVERWAGYLRRVLEEMAADEGRPVERLALMPRSERARVLEEWNRTETAYPAGSCVHRLFEARAERTPGAAAVVFDGGELTYAGLNARANRLAHHLRALGVGPDVRVALVMPRSPELVEAELAVLKCGGAYVPLDPEHPAERLREVLADSAPAALLTTAGLADRFAGLAVPVLALDAGAPAWASGPAANPDVPGLTPEHLAYVMYTSGSTGRPKGVMVPHRAIVRLVVNNGYAAFGPDDRVAFAANPAFDATTMEVWAPLVNGGAVVIVSQDALLDPGRFATALRTHGVSVLWLTVGLFNQYAEALQDEWRRLRYLVVGGDALDPRVIAGVLRRGAPAHLLNGYGPTETTTFAITHEIRRVDDGARGIPLGRPIGNTRVYLLDRAGEPVPVGVAGEVYIGGAGVARGYQGRPALTAERFVPDPLGRPGARLYRTGDLARWLPDGTIEFLGRTDHQVKVRGFRIEPGEIEARLVEHPGVREAVVLVREDAPGEKRLVAYVAGDPAAGAEVLRAYLGERLPSYMVPAAYVRLEQLPLTPNGKVDRRALPAPEGGAYAAREYEAPVGETERALAGIWAEVLRVERVGRHDGFFELGGHSLLAVQVISRVRQALQVEVELGELFTRSVLADFARGLETAAHAELPPIEPAPREGRLPLSFAQQRLWFLEQLGDLGSTYHIRASLRLRGGLDPAALARALDAIVARHEALRTTFAQVDGVPEQRIAPAGESRFHLARHDLAGRADAEAELGRVIAEEAGAPFDLERGPLIRGRLVRLAADDHVLLVTMHHIVGDGWSGGVLTHELGALYGAFRRGEPDPLPPLPVQYADYALWQRRWVEGRVLQVQADYWTRTLADAPELLELPADRPRPSRMDHAGARLPVELDEELTAGLRALGRRHGATLFMTLLAGWAAVLGRLSGQDDVVIGTPTAGRGRREIEGLIGFFVNTLALRLDLSGAPTVAELLARVKTRALGAQHHQDLPFEQVVELVDPVRSLAHHPLFQVMFTWQDTPREGGLSLPGLEVGGVGAASAEAQAKFDLALSLRVAGGRIVGDLTYATALFQRDTVERFVGYLRRALEEMAADEGRRVERLALIPHSERSRVLEEWNRTEADYPAGSCVHELFERQVARTPGAAALVFEGGALTYAELNRRSNRLAHHLARRGVGPDVPVGLCLERGPEMIVALLAVLKAGGAYVPLDPEYPEDRLRYMLADSAPAVLLTQAPLAERFAGDRVPRIRVDTDAAEWAHEPETDPERGALAPEHLAYVIYTSGSTGRPKGVMNPHRTLVNRLAWGRRTWGIDADEAVLCKTSLSFDGSVREIFLPLMAGARVVLARPGGQRDPSYLLETIGRQGITTVNLVPSLLQVLLEAPEVEGLRGLKRILCGGEALPGALLERCRERLPEVELHNLYGPSEAATAVISPRCAAEPGRAGVPIGGPSANARVYVLDAAGEPVPAGAAGELYIGGVPVARGYLGRAALTAERFVPDPFGAQPGARLYRTGDLCRWAKSAHAPTHARTHALEFVGRNDAQVKVRGFRVEPSEIEARLREHPGVREAVVIVREDVPGDRRLVAYAAGGEGVDAESLRAHLAQRLPEYMVPSAYVRLESLPLTPNGKLDRRALPAPEGDAYATRAYEPPAGEVEELLAGIWAEVLRVERVGRRDHFFELGGHSLLAVQVVSRVRQVLQVEVALGELFTRPVLAGFARELEAAARSELPPIRPAPRDGRLPLSFAQQRLWFLEQLGNLGSTYHISRRLRLRGALDRAALVRALDGIVARHESLRTTFAQVDGIPEQRIAPAGTGFHLAGHDLGGRADADAELDRVMAEEVGAPFDLERGPLIRGRLIRLAPDDHVLLVTMHHIVSDAWSMGVLTRELGALYAAHREGREAALPALPVQYADYAAWQRRWVEGEVLREQADYWTRTLAGAPGLLDLPADHPRPSRMEHAAAQVGVVLDEALTAGLRALSRRRGTTLYMTLLAGWAVVLSRLSGQEEVVVGTPAAGRGRREVEGLIGFFVNTLALRLDLSGAPTVAELLGRVKTRSLSAQHHQDIPFEQVVDLVQPARSLAHHPLFQALFAWQASPREGGLSLPGLAVDGVEARTRITANLDLSLSLREAGDRVVGGVTYSTALFEPATVERYAGYLRRVLEEMAADETRRVERLALMPGSERVRVLEEWNRTEVPYPGESCIHHLFEAQVARTPGATAVVFEGEHLAYAELDRRANRLAHHLRGLGVGPDVRVGISLERGLEMMAGLLAILKAGGAYVPLDPSYPQDRLRYMLEDSAPAVLLTQGAPAAYLAGAGVPAVDLADPAPWAHRPGTAPAVPELTPDHLCYVIYTSGSTGRPKGVANRHRSVANLLAWSQDRWRLQPGEAVLQRISFSFDVSVRELFWPLTAGARIVMARPGGHGDPDYVVELIRRERIGTAHLPGLLRAFVEHPAAGACTSLRRVMNGGEALPPSVARRLGELLPDAALYHMYGPTETTVASAGLRWTPEVAGIAAPLGRPIGNTRIYVLDPRGEPVPAGVAGEICIGGAGVARGYLDRPAATAERFVADPFSRRPGARMYRTGDAGRWRHDGTLEFLGRGDGQVKVRGYRIELGEIEARLAEHAGVREAVVAAREDAPGEKRLVAYWTGEAVQAETLRTHARERLPEYMVPAAYVRLEELPRTPNGKVDRGALPAPEGDAYATRAYEPPAGEAEELLAGIWAQVLGVERVGRRDGFFELGGHSLLAVQVISRVRQALGVEVALGELFTRPVLADFARGLETAARAALPPIEPAVREGRLPLSFAQQRLWFLEQLGDLGGTYHLPMRLRLRGGLDRAALVRALDAIVARHEALRTVFAQADGVPEQRIAPADVGFLLREHDLGGRADADAGLGRLVAEEAGAPFDLERGPLIRGRLVRLAADDHVLLVTMHHIVSDGWSIGVLTGELGALYGAFLRGEPDPLPPLPVQYADYAVWQRRWVDGEVLKAQAEYWTETLGGAPERVELPTDRPRPARQDFAGAALAVELDEELTAGLRALGRRQGTTLFMTLLAGWATVLGRLSGQAEVVVGTPAAGRGRREIEGLIGFFVNTLALRLDLSDAPAVAELLGRVRKRALQAQHHQDIPFEQVVERLDPTRSMAHHPLFQVNFTWQDAQRGGGVSLPGLEVGRVATGSGQVQAPFDLSLSLREAGDRIAGGVTYATALFERATVERWAGYLRRVLEEMAADEARPVDRLPLMAASERSLVLEAWNRTEADYPRESCIHELFEAQAARTPDAAAVVFEGERLSYAELNARANRLAHHLRARGVGPEVRVAVCVERGPAMVAGLLAVLKAGGAYVPLDPGHPAERLAYVLADSAPAAVLTQAESRDRFESTGVPVLELDAAAPAWADRPATDPERGALTPAHLAYVMYTSGSTGRPKGVTVPHRGVVNLLRSIGEAVGMVPADRLLAVTTYAFDISVLEIFLPLVYGARTVVLPRERAADPAALAEAVRAHAATVMQATPATWRMLVQAGWEGAPEMRALCGGEALPAELASAVRSRVGALWNVYGPTETTIWSTAEPVRGDFADAAGGAHVPIGRPVANTRVYVLDQGGEPVPVGVAGELCIGGAGVARGYLGRAKQTAERFVADAYAGEPGARLYRTGDLARWRPDGTLEFLGRTDHQVKVRGFRIELGEIEARLVEHPGVREAVVVVREDTPGEKRLVAYVAGDGAAGADALRTHVGETLPEYMVPAACVWLDRLPLTPNGKVDRKALPAPGGDAFARRGYEAPVGDVETALAEIWAEVLGMERVGRHDGFFELGGHSLLAVTLIARMRRRGLHADVRTLFAAPTLAALAAAVVGESAEVQVPPNRIPDATPVITPEMLPLVSLGQAEIDAVVATVPGGAANVQDIYPLAPLQEGFLFHHLATTEGDPYLLATVSRFETRERLDAYLEAFGAVVARHDILRTAIAWEGLAEPVQVVWRQAALPVEEVEPDPAAGDVAAQLYRRFDPRRHRIDVRRAPLLRCHVAREADGERWVLLLLLHHLAGDHTTIDVLRGEIEAQLQGRADALPQPVPFRNFVAQARLGVSPDEHRAFFTEMLGDVDEPTAPFGLLDVRGDGSGIEQARLDVDGGLAARLRERARALGVSAATLCHLAWAQVLARASGRDDVVFGTVLFGRMQGGEGADRVMGPFLNTLPVRVRTGGVEAEAGVRQTQALLATLLRHEHASLVLAQRCSAVDASAPLFTSLLNYRYGRRRTPSNAPAAPPAARNVQGGERTNYPLTLSVDDLGEGFSLAAQAPASVQPLRVCELMHAALESLVQALETAPGAALGRLDVLPRAERRRVVEEWNRTEAPYPAESTIHGLFEAQVDRTPGAVAVVVAGERLTYAELDRRANRLAHRLRALGVGPEDRVALCMERSPELMAAFFGILKAGAAYVALEPTHPAERLAYMLHDSGARLLLSQSWLAERLPAERPETLWVDEVQEALSREPSERPRSGVGPEGLAYVYYTSGSTGRPKGVAMHHQGPVNYFAWARGAYLSAGGRGAPVFSSMAVDLTLANFVPLFAGQPVELLPEGPGVEALAEALRRSPGYGMIKITPTHLSLLNQLLTPEEAAGSTATLVIGADNLTAEPTRFWQDHAPGVRLLNEYGPTETVVGCSLYEIPAGRHTEGRVPFGRPIQNLTHYVLDARMQPVPVGVAGELYIGGVGVARGYLGRPGLTAEKFVPDPFAARPGARFYRTGDRVRWLADGNLEFLGRIDFQVKVRGYRIELGEIEARLREHPGVRHAVAVVREDTPGDPRLVAYWVGDDTAGADVLRTHLGQALPHYMVPAAYVRLERLPVGATGKLDRKALPAPEGDAFARHGYEPPVGETEGALAEIWAEVLGVERVGRWDDFFELGGHSLLAVRVTSRVRQVLEVEVALGEVFARPVLRDFARGVETAARSELPPIEPAPREGPIPLSFAQQRLWFLERLGNQGSTYHMRTRRRLRGELDRDALGRALDRIVARHEALRTVFAEVDGVPEQRIAPADAGFLLRDDDLSGRADAEAELARLTAQETRAPFDLERGPLIRGRLVRLAADDHLLLVTTHHIVSDGWSSGVLARELDALYAAFRRGAPDPLPALEIQYADYAAWQRRWVEGAVLQAQAEYWTRTLAGAPELLELPTDRPRPARMDHAGALLGLELDEALTAGLKALSRRHGTTLFMTLLAGWAVLLSRLSGQDDVVIGTPTANRGRREIEGVIGFFLNTLALRVDLSGAPTVAQLLGRVKERALGAQNHQDIPFEQVVERVNPVRTPAHTPLFQAWLAWNEPQGDGPGLAGGGAREPVPVPVKFDLSLSLTEANGRIGGGVAYATALFDRETVERWAGYLRRVLEEMVAGDRPVERLALLSADERRRVLEEWNRTELEYPREACVHHLFQAQAARTPGAEAVVFEGESLTYAELNARANRLAHHLRSLGVGPDVPVGVCVDRSLELVVGLLALLKAGGAYVALDPELPEERLRYMLHDSRPAALLAHASRAGLFAGTDVPVVAVDADAPLWEARPETDPADVGVGPEHLVYVIYTSGSTGRPKGVMNVHRNVVNRIAGIQERWRLEPRESVLQTASLSFDVSAYELFWPLMRGARVVMTRPDGHRDPAYLVETIRRHGIGTASFVPSSLQLFLEEPGVEECTSLVRVPCGGEALPAPLARRLHERLPHATIYNRYGPSEAATAVTGAVSAAGETSSAVPIGRPMPNARAYVLDGTGEPVPVGVAGELCIGGAGVGRGYLGRPGLTAEKFVPDPFAGEAGARMYRTGDRARWRESAEVRECVSAVEDPVPANSRTDALTHSRTAVLEFLGRIDFQLKVRGFRIEPGEIEARLREHPAVREAVVVALEDPLGGKRLVAYCVAEGEVQAEGLRTHLGRSLPDYMVPAAYVMLDALPLTPSGKLDRAALPAPADDAYARRGYEAPADEAEEALAEIWAEVLGVDRVGRWDSFFELGGHSLLAVRVISRVREVLDVDVPLGKLFIRPVLADFAQEIVDLQLAQLDPDEMERLVALMREPAAG